MKHLLAPSMSYESAKYQVMKALQEIANRFAKPDHPIKVLIDFYTNDGAKSRFTAHEGEGWLIINMLNMSDDNWDFSTTEENIENICFETSKAFSHEMLQYEQFCRNWKYHEDKNNSRPASDPKGNAKAQAADAARELVRNYKTADAAITALKSNTRETALTSPSMRKFLGQGDREGLRRFLSDLYGQLEILRTRSK